MHPRLKELFVQAVKNDCDTIIINRNKSVIKIEILKSSNPTDIRQIIPTQEDDALCNYICYDSSEEKMETSKVRLGFLCTRLNSEKYEIQIRATSTKVIDEIEISLKKECPDLSVYYDDNYLQIYLNKDVIASKKIELTSIVEVLKQAESLVKDIQDKIKPEDIHFYDELLYTSKYKSLP